MANEITPTVIGNLTADPELRYTPSGTAMSRFTIASAPRQFDQQSGQWRDGEPVFLTCTAWRELAEHTAETLHKGDRVVATGRLRQNSWKTDTGEKRSRLELQVDDLGPSLRFTTAKLARAAAAAKQAAARLAPAASPAAATPVAEPADAQAGQHQRPAPGQAPAMAME